MLAVLPDMGVSEARRAIAMADVAQIEWAKKTGKARAAVLRKLCDLMIAYQDDLGALSPDVVSRLVGEAREEGATP